MALVVLVLFQTTLRCCLLGGVLISSVLFKTTGTGGVSSFSAKDESPKVTKEPSALWQ